MSTAWILSEPLTKGSFENVSITWPSGRVFERSPEFQPPVLALFDYAVFGHHYSKRGTSLPIPAGPHNESLTLNVPHGNPRAEPADVRMTTFDSSGREVLCMELTVPIK
jgi:hypothetical protein